MGYPVKPSNSWLARSLSHVPSMARARALEIYALSASQIGTLLDVGSGNGQFIRRMRSLNWDANGVEPDPTAVAYCLSQGLKVFHGTITDLPPHPRYDVITLNHVIEHVPDPVSLLLECKKRLVPGTGRLMIMTPNLNGLGHRWFGRFWRGLEIPRHLLLFTIPSLRKCASRAGLKVNSLRTETRLARMIYSPSLYAKRGKTRIGEKTNFSTTTKARAYLFEVIEEVLLPFAGDAGEELFCVCST
jgi:SAM-dependent methyltransferase